MPNADLGSDAITNAGAGEDQVVVLIAAVQDRGAVTCALGERADEAGVNAHIGDPASSAECPCGLQDHRVERLDPERGKIELQDYAETWIQQRPGLRPRTVDLYSWLFRKHIAPYLGSVPLGRLSVAVISEWRSDLLRAGVSESVAAKAYRLLRGVLATAVEEDKILLTNPCRIRGAGDEHAGERPVLTVAQVFELAQLLGRRSFGKRTQAQHRRLPAALRPPWRHAHGTGDLRHQVGRRDGAVDDGDYGKGRWQP
jgi:Phage integrase, N-terminal SAM-like domain